MASKPLSLPPMVAFPDSAWRKHIVPDEWEACLDAWISLAAAHLSLETPDFFKTSAKDESLPLFLTSYAAETALSQDLPQSSTITKSKQLRKHCFLLSHRLLEVDPPPQTLQRWDFLAHICKIYGKSHAGDLLVNVWRRHSNHLEASLGTIKASLTSELDGGLKGDLKNAESQLKQLNHLLHASPETAAFFMAGSDFLDSLISCYKITNPPLRKAILSTIYLCLIGLTEGEKPHFPALVDQLYSLKSAAEAHKTGATNVNDSLVAELVTATPILKQVELRIETHGSGSNRAKSVLKSLEGFRKAGGSGRPARLLKRQMNKGKAAAAAADEYGHRSHGEIHVHRMSLVSQVQDLFPDLGSGFVVRLLDEYKDDVEIVIAHLLEGSLPPHLENADRSEALESTRQLATEHINDLAPHSTPPQLPARRNVFDDDEFDRLAVDASKIHFGRKNQDQTADDFLQDRSTAPTKAAILSALAAFDSDDDERDDTYDIEDVGGTVDAAVPGNNPEEANADMRDANDEALFRAYKMTPSAFERDSTTRRGKARMAMKEETGMTDEAIEGWSLMLARDPRQMRRLEAKYSRDSAFTGTQRDLAPTAWRSSPAGSGTEDSEVEGSRGRGGARGRGRGGRGGRGNGSVAGPSGDRDTGVARQRKEANKGSTANHNRRDQRARKMARGGFPG